MNKDTTGFLFHFVVPTTGLRQPGEDWAAEEFVDVEETELREAILDAFAEIVQRVGVESLERYELHSAIRKGTGADVREEVKRYIEGGLLH